MKTTDELLHEIQTSSNVLDYFERNQQEMNIESFPEYLEQWRKLKNLSKADIIRGSGIQKNYAYQLFDGKRTPSRDKVIALAFGLKMDSKEVQTLLKQAGYRELYPRDVRDSLILYAFLQKMTVDDTNILLFDHEILVLE